ncbi:MAG: hypothetical protein C4530_13940 [Desulfobacteraceae bacterium]|nr:MAG: hypothetical protein C4530_13940 [Desulfobacteraceae bacterium]
MHIKRFLFVVSLVIVSGCSAFHQPAPDQIHGLYHDRFTGWQEKITRQGWSEALVNELVEQSIIFSQYRAEESDYWDTPRQFVEKGFQGDCEDIAVFAMSNLKMLKYPHRVRILAVKALTGHHAVLKVEMPDGKWKVYETVPVLFGQFDRAFYRPIVEFDENTILYFDDRRS